MLISVALHNFGALSRTCQNWLILDKLIDFLERSSHTHSQLKHKIAERWKAEACSSRSLTQLARFMKLTVAN